MVRDVGLDEEVAVFGGETDGEEGGESFMAETVEGWAGDAAGQGVQVDDTVVEVFLGYLGWGGSDCVLKIFPLPEGAEVVA